MDSNTLANLNELFKDRHALAENTIDATAFATDVTFQEEDNDGHRQFVNLTKKAYDFTESIAPTPSRAKGVTKFTLVSDFIASVLAAQKSGATPQIEIHAQPKAAQWSNYGRVIYDATTHNGALGHGDWRGELCAQPNIEGQEWVAAIDKDLPFTEFAKLVYRAGNAVIDKDQWPKNVLVLAQRLKLQPADSVADLLALENGFDGIGEFEESTTIDPHNGDYKQTVSRKNKPQVAVPKAFMFYYEPFAGYGKAVLMRLSYRIQDKIAIFTCQPINLDGVCRELADNLYNDLHEQLSEHQVPVYKTI